MTSSVPDAEAKMIACARGAGSEVFKTTAIVLGVIDVLLILLLVAFIYLTRTADITYTARVKKILSQYKSYIQRIKNLFETHGYQIIVVDTFDELLEIKDTIQAPILMYENEDKTCTKFMIPTDSKLLYLYEIKVDGYVEPETEPKEEPIPTTIVKPNIKNVVRPIVKVVVNSPAPAPAPAGQRAGPCLLAVRDCRAVPLVAGRMGWAHPPVRGGGATGGRGGLLSTVQPPSAEFGLSCRRCGHLIVPFGTFAHVWGYFPAEKNEKFCKKPLSLWAQMV
jgi:hypothetical protein